MGELDRFRGKGGSSLPVAKSGSQLPAEQALPWQTKPKGAESEASQLLRKSVRGRFAIALDATGSMTHLLEMAKASIQQIIASVVREAGRGVEIQLFAYRDYDVPSQILEKSEASNDGLSLATWLAAICALGGGGNDGEAIEQALTAIRSSGDFDAVLLAGDEPHNSRAFLDREGKASTPTAVDLARTFGQSSCPIHTFVVGIDPRTRASFEEIAKNSGGCSGTLDGSQAMIDMAVMAMIAQLKGKESVRRYMAGRELPASSKAFGDRLLLGGPKR